MTVRMQYQTLPFGGFTNVDITAFAVDAVKLRIGDSHPASLTFTLHNANYLTPIPRLAFIRFWDSGATDANGNSQSETNPIFEGFVESATPSDDGFSVDYICNDPTCRASNQVTIMSVPWTQGVMVSGSNGTRPIPGIGAVPRLVYNCAIDNDPDYAFSVGQYGTVGQIVAGLLEYQYQPLYWVNAAPGDGSAAGNGSAYRLNTSSGTGAGAELSGMTFVPQEKMVFESESVRSAITRLMQQYSPNFRLLWQQGERQWRFYDLTQANQVTLTLNDFTGTYKVLSYSLDPSIEERYTAVKIYGPQATAVAAPGGEGDVDAFTTQGSAPTLVALGSGITLQEYSTQSGMFSAVAYTRYQIVDSTKRRGAKALSRTITVPMVSPSPDLPSLGYQFIPVKSPCLQISFDHGATWMTVLGTFFDFQNGIADCVNPLYYWADPPPVQNSTQQFFPPNAVRLVWAYYVDPLSVRKPTSGFEGTAYTSCGLESIFERYDESLAVGYEWGTAVTSTTRRASFEILAQQLLDERKNIVWTGGAVLEGLKYQFSRLQKRINFTSETATGGALTTGWEAINAFLTDVEYDYTNQVTSLTFSSDQMALMAVDCERLKEVLKIKALEQVPVYSMFIQMRDYKTWSGKTIKEAASVQTTQGFKYVDSDTGRQG